MELLQSLVITALFGAIIPWGIDVWILADTVITTIFGLIMIFVPKQFLQRQVTGNLDDVHIHMYRMCGIMLLCSSVFSMMARKSKDIDVKTAILWGRVLGVSLYVLARIHGYTVTTEELAVRWNRHALVFGIYGDCLWLSGNIVYAVTLIKTQSRYTKTADVYLMSDFVQCLLFGASFYVCPGTMLGFQTNRSLGNLHLTLIRMMAAFVFNTGIIAWRSLHFTSNRDQIKHWSSRIISNSCLITAQLYAQITTTAWTNWHIYFGMVGMSLWSVNASLGYLRLIGKESEKDSATNGSTMRIKQQ